jgi:hypothetical protein
MSRARLADKPRLRRSFALPAPGPRDVTPPFLGEGRLASAKRMCRPSCHSTKWVMQVLARAWTKRFLRAHVASEDRRQAPAQAELRPTCAGASRRYPACFGRRSPACLWPADVSPVLLSYKWVRQVSRPDLTILRAHVANEGRRQAPAQAELRPTCAGASRRYPPCFGRRAACLWQANVSPVLPSYE